VQAAQEDVVAAALDAGADSCLVVPVRAKELALALAWARRVNQTGRHTLSLNLAQEEDRWRDEGGEA
jgi:hypothetical protein